MDKQKVHIVVEGGLVQAVYADNGLDVDVVIYDLDADDKPECIEVCKAVMQLSDRATLVY